MNNSLHKSRYRNYCCSEQQGLQNPESNVETFYHKDKEGLTININIHNTYNIGNKDIHIEQRAEGGGQINKDVGANANQGGQNALNNSKTKNNKSQFADGNGRSGIAGDDNDEAGGQQGIKIRDSWVKRSRIKSSSAHTGGLEGELAEDSIEESNQVASQMEEVVGPQQNNSSIRKKSCHGIGNSNALRRSKRRC